MNTRREVIIGAGALVIIALSVYFVARTGSVAPISQAPATGIPPLTPEMQTVLAKSHGFQALVSYTDRGFEPATLTIKKGQTIRFTNNSSKDLLWVAATGAKSGKIYPSSNDACGQSTFDVCQSLKPHEFWEFTFDVAGTWNYTNNLDKTMQGVVHVTP